MNCIVLDQGNTSVKWGLFQNKELIASGRITNEALGLVLPQLHSEHTVPFYYSSVRSNSDQQDFLVRFDFCKLLRLENFPKYNFSSGNAGTDRLANVAGANALFGENETLIIDFGTCITYSIGKNNELISGVISLGAQSRLRGMHEFTGQLPLLQFTESTTPFQNSTKQSMLSSVHFGILSELKGYIDAAIIQFPEIKIVFTGTDAVHFAKQLNCRIFVELNLTLIGLYVISRANES